MALSHYIRPAASACLQCRLAPPRAALPEVDEIFGGRDEPAAMAVPARQAVDDWRVGCGQDSCCIVILRRCGPQLSPRRSGCEAARNAFNRADDTLSPNLNSELGNSNRWMQGMLNCLGFEGSTTHV